MSEPNGFFIDGLFVPYSALYARGGHPKLGWRETEDTWTHWCLARAGRVTFTRSQRKCDLCQEGL